MEFNCSKHDLAKGVQIVERAVGSKSTLPIIGNILMETTDEGIKLASNNLEIGIEVLIPSTIANSGKILAPAKTLGSIVSKLPDDIVTIETFDNFTVKINSGQSKFNIHGIAADEFLSLNKLSEGTDITFNAGQFKEMIKQVIFAVSMDESKHILNGVFFEMGWDAESMNKLRMVSTDGYRLAMKTDTMGTSVESHMSFVIPTKALQELASIIGNSTDETISLRYASDQVAFSFKSNYIVTRVIQGQFPDFNQVIPKTSQTTLTIDRKAFLDAADRCAIIASSSANIVRLELADNKLLIAARTPDVGEVSEMIDVEVTGEPAMQVSFNVRLLIDVLKIFSDEKIALNLSSSFNPGLIKPENSDNYQYVIMPIRTAENR